MRGSRYVVFDGAEEPRAKVLTLMDPKNFLRPIMISKVRELRLDLPFVEPARSMEDTNKATTMARK